MAKDPPQVISNSELSEADLKKIEDAVAEMARLENERSAINADIDAERKKVIALGIPAEALRASVARSKMDPEQREAFDQGRRWVDQALGIPVQADLFANDDGDEEDAGDGKASSNVTPIPTNLH